MLRSDDPDLRPSRGYDELLAMSRARGRSLRRRRRWMQSAPIVGVVAATAALVLAGPFGDAHGLDRLRQTTVEPTHSTSGSPAPEVLPTSPATGPAGPRPVTSAVANVALPLGNATPAPATPATTGAPQQAAPKNGSRVLPQVLDFSDPTGDATAQGASASAVSDPTLDITDMRFETTSAGLRVTMRLGADFRSNGEYLAYLTDARTSWQIQLVLGGPVKDYAYAVQWSAGGATTVSSQYIPLPDTPDPSPREIVAVIPWASFPATVDPHDQFNGVSGQTRLMQAGHGVVADDAATDKTMGPMLR